MHVRKSSKNILGYYAISDTCLNHILGRPDIFFSPYVCMFCHQMKLLCTCMRYLLKNMILICHDFSQVVKDRKWKEVTMVFKYPSTITSASFVLRKYYQSLLYHFEQVYYFRKKTPSVLATGNWILTLLIPLSAIYKLSFRLEYKNRFNFFVTDSVSTIVNGSSAQKDSATVPHLSGKTAVSC